MKKWNWLMLLASLVVLAAAAELLAESVTLPPGIVLRVRNDISISTENNLRGDPVQATVVEPVLFASQEVVPIGTTLTGKLREVKKPGRLRGRGQLRLVFQRLELPTGEVYSLRAVVLEVDDVNGELEVISEGALRGASSRRKDATAVGAGAGTGAVIGGIAAGPAGAIIGAGIGGGVMLGDRLVRRGRHAYLDAGTELLVELTHPVQLLVE